MKRPSVRKSLRQARAENARLQRTVAELKEKLEIATQASLVDTLTGLLSRRALENEKDLMRQCAQEAEEGVTKRRRETPVQSFGILVVDLSNFKKINDDLGHAVGDRALVEVSRALRTSIRTRDKLFRIGGDEFVIVLENVTLDEIKIVARRSITNIERISEWFISARIGGMLWNVVHYPNADPEDVQRRADELEVALRNAGKTGEIDIREYTP